MKTALCVFLFLACFTTLWAQSGVLTGYGEASGAGGSVSSSLGQVFFTFSDASTGSSSEGLQQAYVDGDISIREREVASFIYVYPNPTRGLVYLDLPDVGAPWHIAVYDIRGQLLGRFPHPTGRSQWSLPSWAGGAYLFCFYAGSELISRSTLFKHH